MLLRLTVDNFRSVGETTVLNLVANPRLEHLQHQVTRIAEVDTLRLAVLYGPNGSGKSSLVDALRQLQNTVLNGDQFPNYVETTHRFGKGSENPITIGAEFVVNDRIYSYAVRYGFDRIEEEELYAYGNGGGDPELLFKRNGDKEVTVYADWRQEAATALAPLLRQFTSDTRSALKGLTVIEHPRLREFKAVYHWLAEQLLVLQPREFPRGLAQRLDAEPGLMRFARDLVRSYHVGIEDIVVESLSPEDYFGKDDQDQVDYIRAAFKNATAGEKLTKYLGKNEEISVVLGENGPVVKRILLVQGDGNEMKNFRLSEVSDGTSRLLELIPAFYRIVNTRDTVVIDELERSIHPSMVRALVEKYSADRSAKGQLIFTTHEDILLDQSILRRDGTFFVEKTTWGTTHIHSLNKFKPHHTKNIRRGYLEGRYGGVPYVNDVATVKWSNHDS